MDIYGEHGGFLQFGIPKTIGFTTKNCSNFAEAGTTPGLMSTSRSPVGNWKILEVVVSISPKIIGFHMRDWGIWEDGMISDDIWEDGTIMKYHEVWNDLEI